MNVSESMTARDFYNFASQHYEEIKDAREKTMDFHGIPRRRTFSL